MAPQKLIGLAVAATVLTAGFSARRAQYLATPHVSRSAPKTPASDQLPFELRDRSAQAGILHRHEAFAPDKSLARVAPMITATAGASVTVADFDGDGWPDIYFTNAAKNSLNKLYRNNHDGTFTEIAARVGLADVNREAGSLRALAFDFDNDGRVDLFLSTSRCPRLFHQTAAGKFVDVTAASGIDHCGYSHASTAVDVDGDGRLDLITADYYGDVDLWHPKTTKFLFNRLADADNGGPIHVYRNLGGMKFSRVPDALGIASRGWTHAIGAYDLRGSGKPDLYFATDFNVDQLYFQEDGRYRNASNLLGRKYLHFGMSAEIARTEEDQAPSIYVTDMYDPGHTLSANTLWKFGEGRPSNIAPKLGAAQCGWSWGAKFLDLDNDGALDLVVANGMLSADPDQDYWFKLGTLQGSSRRFWQDASLWPPFGKASWAGYQTKCVFRRDGKSFRDVSDQTDMGSDDSDGRGVAAIDVLNNGSLGVVESNVGQRARLFLNKQLNRNHWIGFTLVGTRSNRDAVGAQVTVEADGRRQVSDLYPANGFQSQSDGRVHVGLGASKLVSAVSIRWPSGKVQRLTGLAVDRYHRVVEPK